MTSTTTSTITLAETRIALADLADDWVADLAATGRHAKPTVKHYGDSVRGFLRWHATEYPAAEPVLDKATAKAWLADLREAGQSPGTVRLRYVGLRQFSRWLAEEHETSGDVLDGMKPPRLREPVVPHLADAEVAAMLAACEGPDFRDRRDLAILHMLLSTGMRASELLGLKVADVDERLRKVVVRHGKGNRQREPKFGPKAAKALRRYLRARERHPLARTEALWLPSGRASFSYDGLNDTLKMRARLAGVERFHVHRTRHTWAVKAVAQGLDVTTIMDLAGWSSPAMLARYSKSAQRQLSHAAYDRNPIDF